MSIHTQQFKTKANCNLVAYSLSVDAISKGLNNNITAFCAEK